ncbi:ABC transporter substrate-binding protein [Clostridium swellfunianum]|uniref:ABC transporter substrate-binding protein n=1 Tax=Clostridium swellfunianum TaxID=1367462 RepID=UPI00202EE4F0|nr:ABC transporter substrate-binding protein [Clostridium swellfunianum]MCM0651040.1 ABC transporter substrate-binding protein [Clostridium swellfunianum]
MKSKKVLSLILSSLLVGTMLMGCKANKPEEPANAKPGEDKKVTLTYWQHSSQARDTMMQNLAKDFMEKNKNIEVKLEFIPEADYFTKLISSLATDAAPDVFQVQSGFISRLAKVGSIKPLDESVLPTNNVKNDFISAAVDGLTVDGKYYGLPTDIQTIVLYWNKDLVSAAGLDAEKGPKTWDEMREWAKKLTKSEGGKMTQSGWGEKGYNPEVQALMVQNGGKLVDSNGKYVFADDEKSVEAIKFMVDAYKVDKVYDTKFLKNWEGFRQGKVSMMLGHPAMLGNLKKTAPNVKLGIGLIPAKAGKNTTIVTSWAYSMSKKADSKAATKWIEYLTSAEVQKKWTKETGELPGRKALLNDAELTADPNIKLLISSLNDSAVGYLQSGSLNTIWSTAFEKLILTDAPLKETLKQMQDDLNKEIAKDLK